MFDFAYLCFYLDYMFISFMFDFILIRMFMFLFVFYINNMFV